MICGVIVRFLEEDIVSQLIFTANLQLNIYSENFHGFLGIAM